MRRTKLITVTADGRDKGKVFYLTELPASQAERWATRALMAMANTVDIPANVQQAGMAGIATLGLHALSSMSFVEAEPLLAEMFTCVQCVPDPNHTQVRRALIEDDIEEVTTRLMLRREVIDIHVGFSAFAYLQAQVRNREVSSTTSSATPISQTPSDLSSPVNSPPSTS